MPSQKWWLNLVVYISIPLMILGLSIICLSFTRIPRRTFNAIRRKKINKEDHIPKNVIQNDREQTYEEWEARSKQALREREYTFRDLRNRNNDYKMNYLKQPLTDEKIGISKSSSSEMQGLLNKLHTLDDDRKIQLGSSRKTLPFINDNELTHTNLNIYLHSKLAVFTNIKALITKMRKEPGINKVAFNKIYTRETMYELDRNIMLHYFKLDIAFTKMRTFLEFGSLPRNFKYH